MLHMKVIYWDSNEIPATTKEKRLMDSWENIVFNLRHWGITPEMIISIERIAQEA